MNNKEHLPIYGIGPLLCFPLVIIMLVLFVLSLMEIIPTTNFTSEVNTVLIVMGIILIVMGVVLLFGADAGGNLTD